MLIGLILSGLGFGSIFHSYRFLILLWDKREIVTDNQYQELEERIVDGNIIEPNPPANPNSGHIEDIEQVIFLKSNG